MSSDVEFAQLVGRRPDQRLLGEELGQLPESVGRPVEIPPDPARAKIVGIGATMTGIALFGGILLAIVGLIAEVADGGTLPIVVLAVGALLALTHWGWVHIAEITANSVETGHQRELTARREDWLAAIEPYTRWSVTTSVENDGAIEIVKLVHRPIPLGEDRFTFARTVELRERHDGDEPGAAVTERAEEIRRGAALDTERERERYEVAAAAYRDAAMRHEDEEERRAAVRAASQALSDRINTHLKDPPLSG
ncbi:MAG TPA: hypothetical protein VG223_09165 [Solirubrobacteraceae bacterium]|jgi:hypothetical protein|nr:hypothetical protein [Solirubrobacteraceae bacterium]